MVKTQRETVVRAKGMLDGCNSMDEVIQAAEGFVSFLKKMKEDGWVLKDLPVEDDYAFLKKVSQRGR